MNARRARLLFLTGVLSACSEAPTIQGPVGNVKGKNSGAPGTPTPSTSVPGADMSAATPVYSNVGVNPGVVGQLAAGTSGTAGDVDFPYRGAFTPGISDPTPVGSFNGYRISCTPIATATPMAEADARKLCPSTCQALGNGLWDGYWHGDLCECMQKLADMAGTPGVSLNPATVTVMTTATVTMTATAPARPSTATAMGTSTDTLPAWAIAKLNGTCKITMPTCPAVTTATTVSTTAMDYSSGSSPDGT